MKKLEKSVEKGKTVIGDNPAGRSLGAVLSRLRIMRDMTGIVGRKPRAGPRGGVEARYAGFSQASLREPPTRRPPWRWGVFDTAPLGSADEHNPHRYFPQSVPGIVRDRFAAGDTGTG
jgi:hypothetical protein